MTFLLKIWGFLKKVPGWLWVALLILLSVLIPSFGWWRERNAHKKTKAERDAERDRAERAAAVAVAEAEARGKIETALKKAQETSARIHEENERISAVTIEVSERIDAGAGNVHEVADDINRELGLE